jgi:hypothetical protein
VSIKREKLRPDQDLQCFFFHPSAIAALSGTSASGFTLSGTWRQQFDWAVVEWDRDNVYEHPALRNLPDGDLSGLTLTYDETRTNCIPIDSDLFHTVSWPFLRIWAPDANGVEQVYQVPLAPLATPIQGSYAEAYADFTLSGTLTAGDFVGLAYLDEHVTYQIGGWEGTIENVLVQMVAAFASSSQLRATSAGSTIRVYYTGGAAIGSGNTGANGNRFSLYSYSCSASGGASTFSWDSEGKTFANGTSPTQWQITIPFNSLQGYIDPDYSTLHTVVNPNQIRRLRWTYSADLQAGAYARSEFQVQITNWTVTGTNQVYSVAGPGSLRFEDDSSAMVYSGSWTMPRGNYSGGTIHYSQAQASSLRCTYQSPVAHTLYVGLRYTGSGAQAAVTVDGRNAGVANLLKPGEDVLIRWPAGQYSAGSHTVTITHQGPANADLYFDFVEAAVPSTSLPTFPDEPRMTLATDWDTDHSLALAPERTAWLIDTLGFKGRANHYIGALWFYELANPAQVYASATVTFSGGPDTNPSITNSVGLTIGGTQLTKLVHMGDTAATLALAFANELNRGYMSFWGKASGNVLTIYSRSMGTAGNSITVAPASSAPSVWQLTPSGTHLAGGVDGTWITDLAATPRLNRAARDWTTSFFAALNGPGIDVASSLSMELGNGDPSTAAGIAQRGPLGDPILLPTPSLQTNFSPTSLAFWQEAYAEIAAMQAAAGLQPFLQFGEVQWWYFPNNGEPSGPAFVDYHGMPFYDAWTISQFQAQYGHPMAQITTNTVNPAAYPNEVAFLAFVLGNFTTAVMNYVRSTQPQCRFEVLYPTDVNQAALNQIINFPTHVWTPANLTGLKTECFGFTLGRDLTQSQETIDTSFGFPVSQRSHLVGIGDSTTAWSKEAQKAVGKKLESVVLFALDQLCLIGYGLPLPVGLRRSLRMAS